LFPNPKRLAERIEIGRKIKDRYIANRHEALTQAKTDRDEWSHHNHAALTELFEGDSVAKEYDEEVQRIPGAVHGMEPIEKFRKSTTERLRFLESVMERFGLKTEAGEKDAPAGPEAAHGARDVFVVHGHDEGTKQSVARFIEKLQLKAVILHEQANQGRTIIEKFEDYSNVGFAVVLLTPDDVGKPKDREEDWKPRARQNVILELGFFLGKLGRERVCVLHKGDVEIPSDYQGVLYVPMDDAGAWRSKIAKEIKEDGIDVDLNKAI
jgi:predicted nucleotide-binding protein